MTQTALALGVSTVVFSPMAVAQSAQKATTLAPVEVVDEAIDPNPNAEPGIPYKARTSGDERHVKPLVETPQTIQVLTQQQMKDTGRTDLRDVLRAQPGITLGTGENGNAFSERYLRRARRHRRSDQRDHQAGHQRLQLQQVLGGRRHRRLPAPDCRRTPGRKPPSPLPDDRLEALIHGSVRWLGPHWPCDGAGTLIETVMPWSRRWEWTRAPANRAIPSALDTCQNRAMVTSVACSTWPPRASAEQPNGVRNSITCLPMGTPPPPPRASSRASCCGYKHRSNEAHRIEVWV